MSAKKVWGSQPGKERGSMSQAEKAYLRACYRALCEGFEAGKDPRLSEAARPSRLSEEMAAYWLDGFRMVRRSDAAVLPAEPVF